MESADELLLRCEKLTKEAEEEGKLSETSSAEATRLFHAAIQKQQEAKFALRSLCVFQWFELHAESAKLIATGKPLMEQGQTSLENCKRLVTEAEQLRMKLEKDFPISN